MGALGYLLMRIGWIDSHFVNVASSFCFRVLLPVSLFKQLYSMDSLEQVNTRLILFSIAALFILLVLTLLLTPVFAKGCSKPQMGAIAHGIYCSNFVFVGLPIMENAFGQEGVLYALSVLPFAIAFFNVGGVLIFTLFAPDDPSVAKISLSVVVKNILKNPLILALLVSALFLVTGIRLPGFLFSTIESIAPTATPLALITLGAQLDFKAACKNLKISGITTFLRLVVLPSLVLAAGAFLGFRGVELGLLLILCGTPCAISGFSMAKSMKSDAALTSEITILTTFFSTFTLFAGIVAIGWIG